MDCLFDGRRRSSVLAGFLLLGLAACAPKASDTQAGTGTQSTSTDGAGDSGASAVQCADHATEESCYGHVEGSPDGHHECAWAKVFTVPNDPEGCELGDPVGRCMDVWNTGDGCWATDCVTYPFVYFRATTGDELEIFAHEHDCNMEPDGWERCSFDGQHPPPGACSCLCD
jgi:hypothetical protein